jgi:hypothetical protein
VAVLPRVTPTHKAWLWVPVLIKRKQHNLYGNGKMNLFAVLANTEGERFSTCLHLAHNRVTTEGTKAKKCV